MSIDDKSGTTTPDHYFVKIEEDGKTRYVLCGAVASFDKDNVSEATLQGIEARFRLQTLPATPTDMNLDTLPWNFELYSFQSGRN
ncbi:hypothetical protein [Aurantiacibacter poecillastricola]|uniref:hypothetical protein n=1 Tax=Aurantiacibacter poecillastricola TaxID=3064385 RepID=UPI00273FBCDE|nr:hypothetical protein [Aurantiacibacter sp. 219JJ12-13]MDP5261350.1 hypothetical protein [Aurantiacibacter sp. 219JJ12-13]